MININGEQIEYVSPVPITGDLPNGINIYLSLDQTRELIKELKYALEESIDHQSSHSVVLTSRRIDVEISVNPHYKYEPEELPFI